ncbi:MAG: biotin--[acetyl-CoA-carboxylase] ligase [Acutalibacteraceae bacterium]|jgi:BirA family biotin operon repressor/biotin-[acetyl-CoA-carboxylase] ligase
MSTNPDNRISTLDPLSSDEIQKHLNGAAAQNSITVLPVTISTNTVAREMAADGAPEGTTVIAEEQTAGRGRRGRSFFSPKGTGIYISILLRPYNCTAAESVKITTMAAVAMCEAIEEISGKTAGIKWVNDIFIEGKKISGILTEAATGQDGFLDFAIVGVGVNVYEPVGGFPKELENSAGAILRSPVKGAKNRLAAEFLNQFMRYYKNFDGSDYVEKYRNRSIVIGKRIKIMSTTGERYATATGIDNSCRLEVEYEDGTKELLSSGEISIRF